MKNVESSNLENNFLEPFLGNTPLSILRIRGAWDILSPAQKAFLIEQTLQSDFYSTRLRSELEGFFMSEASPYLRSLAAKHIEDPYILDKNSEPSEIEKKQLAIIDQIKTDPSELVQASIATSKSTFPWAMRPEEFWRASQIERLAFFTGTSGEEGSLAEVITYAIDNLEKEDVTLDQVEDVLLEYLTWDKNALLQELRNAEWSSDGHRNYSARKGLEELWQIIPKIPWQLKVLLLQLTPPYEGGIPNGLVSSLDENEIFFLLRREDIAMLDVRRAVWEEGFWDGISFSMQVRSYAVHHPDFNFEYRKLLLLKVLNTDTKDEAKEKWEKLNILAYGAIGATLAQLTFIEMVILDLPSKFDRIRTEWIYEFVTRRHQMLLASSSAKLKSEVLECQLLHQCQNYISTADNYYAEKYSELAEYVIADNQLETFVNIMEAIEDNKLTGLTSWAEKYEYLPPVGIGGTEYDAIECRPPDAPNTKKKGFW